MGFATGYKEAARDVVLAVPKRVWTAIATAIALGDAFCYNGDLATDERGNTEAATAAGSGRHRVVEKPTLANIGDFAGFAAQAYGANAYGQWIEINVPRIGQTLPVKAKANCTIMSSVLGPIPTQHHVREGCLYPEAGFALLALQTVNRATTVGTVQCRVIPADSPLVKASTIEFWNDFLEYDDSKAWAAAEDAAGKDTLGDAAGGILTIAPDTTEENATCVSSIAEVFKAAAGKPIRFKARISGSEAGTDGDENNIAVGLSDVVTVDMLQDAGAGPAATFDGVLIYKVDGASVFAATASNAAVPSDDADIGAFVKDTMYEVEFLIDPNDGTTAAVNAWVDKVLGTATALTLTLAGLEEMHIALFCKVGNDDVNAENLKVDYVLVRAVR